MTEQQIAAVDVATVFCFLGPANGPAIAAEQRVCRSISRSTCCATSAKGETNSASSGQ